MLIKLKEIFYKDHKQLVLLQISCAIIVLITIMVGQSLLPHYHATASDLTVVKIPSGYTTQEVAELLLEHEVIDNTTMFAFWVRLSGYSASLQAGTYAFDPNETIPQIIEKIGTGSVFSYESTRVTIPEGYTLKQIAELLSEKGIVSTDEFLMATNTADLPYDWVQDIPDDVLYKYEGYLFPDTYDFASYQTAQDIIRRMADRFNEVVFPLYQSSELKEKYSLHEIITLASIIEKEAMYDDERSLISSVFHNRLNKNYLLQSCATVQYILPVHREVLSTEETKTESPYNTYLYAGLPPGPISSVGYASVEAALNPADTKYYFFNAINNGRHNFSVTYAEHLRSIRENK